MSLDRIRPSSASGTTLPTWPQAMMQVSWRWVASFSESDLRIPRALPMFRFAISSGMPLPKLFPKNVVMVLLGSGQIGRGQRGGHFTDPAATRSSLTELWRLCRHHCPAMDVSKSRNSGSTECRTSRLKAIIAITLGRFDSRKRASRISLAKVVVALDLAVTSRHVGRSSAPRDLQKEQLNFEAAGSSEPGFVRVLSDAHPI